MVVSEAHVGTTNYTCIHLAICSHLSQCLPPISNVLNTDPIVMVDYKSKGYKTMYEGMIGEAEKEGRGEEVRERLDKFQRTNKIKAASVLVVAIGSFLAARSAYWADPDSFLPGI